jgi:2-polyprenyl-3-methyl-5-hydroxy-6-metoxy-1,4-benzoquinol methylase
MTIIVAMDIKTLSQDSEMIKSSGICYLCHEGSLDTIQDFPWLVKCRSCGLVFNPDLSINSREVSDRFYDQLNMEHRRRIKSVLLNVANVRWRWLQKRLELQNGHILEIGCGTGEFLVVAKRKGWRVEGLELSEKFREAAKTWYALELKGEELSQANYPAETFDVVALLHVFEHLPNPLEFLTQIVKLVKPGGWLFIVVPNLSSWTDSLFGKSSPTLIKMDHFFHYDDSTLQKMIARSDFILAEIATLEPSHHLWTSLYGFLASKRKSQLTGFAKVEKQKEVSLAGKIKSNLPYWMGTLTSGLLLPLRLWLRKNNRGHEIYFLCRRRP